jgi:hypothetical protein
MNEWAQPKLFIFSGKEKYSVNPACFLPRFVATKVK